MILDTVNGSMISLQKICLTGNPPCFESWKHRLLCLSWPEGEYNSLNMLSMTLRMVSISHIHKPGVPEPSIFQMVGGRSVG